MQDKPAIFISYRRDDAGGHARNLHEYLSGRFGGDRVFFDRSTIESGDVFPEKLRWGVEGCAVLLALIGPEWLDVLDDNGGRRLDDADDFVRREIALALEKGKKVIPVLLDDTPIPPRDRLPDPLKALASRDALTLGGKTYEYQTQRRELVRLLANVRGVPQPLPEPEADPYRYKMLEKVRRVWIDDYLEHSLDNLARIELGLEEKPDALSRPWDLIVQLPDRAPRPLPPGQSMAAIFDELGRALLILGAPGSGKTTLLLELARDLLDRAVQDTKHLIPVIFHLSTWAARRRPLADWLVDELFERYHVPRKLAQTWVNAEQVLPLLDGLDEVAPEHREACVEAINTFRHTHSLVPLAVCSRAADYEALRVRMELSGAVTIRPLSREQVGIYLKQAGQALVGVQTALQEDETLWELLQTPLMLGIVALTYQGRSAAEVRVTGSLEQRRTQLFENYTQRMFERRSKVTAYTPDQTLRWLTWLAKSLIHNNLSVFYLEWMQPDWLPSRVQRWIVAMMPVMTTGLFVGPSILLVIGLVLRLAGGLVGTSVCRLVEGLIMLLIVFIFMGCVMGGVLDRKVGELECYHLILLLAFLIVLRSELKGGLRITPAEALQWSWRRVRRYSIMGLVAGSIAALVAGSIAGLAAKMELEQLLGMLLYSVLILGPVFGLIGGLAGGLTAGQIATRTLPNEGIRRSLRNALVSFLTLGLVVFGLNFGLNREQVFFFGLLYGLVAGQVASLVLCLSQTLCFAVPFAVRRLFAIELRPVSGLRG